MALISPELHRTYSYAYTYEHSLEGNVLIINLLLDRTQASLLSPIAINSLVPQLNLAPARLKLPHQSVYSRVSPFTSMFSSKIV